MKAIAQFIEHLESEKASCLVRANDMAEDYRVDESNIEKIKANVFGIFATVSRVAGEQFPDNPQTFIRRKIDSITKEWQASLSQAEWSDNYTSVLVERVKLDTLTIIDETYERMLGGSDHA